MGKTSIEWTDLTWNPTRGCTPCDPGCLHCYAMRQAIRMSGPGKAYEGLVKLGGKGPVWTGDVRLVPENLAEPLTWREPRNVFVDSMSDLFQDGVPFEFIAAVFGVMAATRRHTYQVLTKRADRMLGFFDHIALRSLGSPVGVAQAHAFARIGTDARLAVPNDCPWPLPNVLLGVSVSEQTGANARIPVLLQVPAARRFVSYEPALGPVDFRNLDCSQNVGRESFVNAVTGEGWYRSEMGVRVDAHAPHLDGIIIGAESGAGARPFDEDWARTTRDACESAGIAFFYKQRLDEKRHKVSLPLLDGRQHTAMPMARVSST